MAVGEKATGPSNETGFEAPRRSNGLIPVGMPPRTPSAVGHRHMAPVVIEPAELTVESRFPGHHASVLALGIEKG